MAYRRIKGTADILPQNAGGSVELRQMLESVSQRIFERFGYREIRTPVIEEMALFVKCVGEETDIVTKEMFSFKDRGERDIVLRPEGTAPIVRAYLEANLHKTDAFQKFYYIGPMFRAERPQAGRMRQFHQIGAEAIGSSDPAIDAEIIKLLVAILDGIKVEGYRLRMNNLGCKEDKANLSKALRKLLAGEKAALCDDCKKRLDTNALRVLDCKNESCRAIVRGAFKSVKFLCKACEGHFAQALPYLDKLNIKYELDPYIVRGLDYYTGTVFEVTHHDLGSQDALAAGGRYDNLISDMGGPSLGAIGFALGVERVLMAAAKGAAAYSGDSQFIYIATIGEEAHRKAFELVNSLRAAAWDRPITFDMDYEGKSLKAQMRQADKSGANPVLIIGGDEMASGEVTLRDMKTKEQANIKFTEVASAIKQRLG